MSRRRAGGEKQGGDGAGLLVVDGTLEVAQFWPHGESDGDTAKVLVGRIAYAADGELQSAEPTRIFQGAKVRGRVSKEVIDPKGRLTIRWQGIDAPELHYRAQAEIRKDDPEANAKRTAFRTVNKSYRQHLGETSTVMLYEKVQSLAGGAKAIPCRVTTYVRTPNQVFDTYGRLVGDVVVADWAGNDVNLNRWMLETGWAFPTFYASMLESEVRGCLAAVEKAKGRGVWQHYSQDLGTFDWNLVYDKLPFDAKADAGPVLMPKIFRRQVAYRTNKKARIISGTLQSYLATKDPPETYMRTSDFLENGATASPHRLLRELVKGERFLANPQDLVFPEAPSLLFDANGKRISDWS